MERLLTGLLIGYTVRFEYENHRGVTENRCIRIDRVEYKSVEDYYPEKQWLITGFCKDRQATRTFALTKMKPIND